MEIVTRNPAGNKRSAYVLIFWRRGADGPVPKIGEAQATPRHAGLAPDASVTEIATDLSRGELRRRLEAVCFDDVAYVLSAGPGGDRP
jgi:hypothetical protein